MEAATPVVRREPWNKGKIVGQKVPLKPKDIWALRARLQMEHRTRELAAIPCTQIHWLSWASLPAGPTFVGNTKRPRAAPMR